MDVRMTATANAIPAGRVVVLHRTFPCCGGRSRFLVEADSYERRCRRCGATWTVRRITRPASDFARRLAVRVDALEWERMAGGEA